MLQASRKAKSENRLRLRPSIIQNFLTMFLVFVIFTICWAPLDDISLAMAINPKEIAPQVPEGLLVKSYILAYFNSCLHASSVDFWTRIAAGSSQATHTFPTDLPYTYLHALPPTLPSYVCCTCHHIAPCVICIYIHVTLYAIHTASAHNAQSSGACNTKSAWFLSWYHQLQVVWLEASPQTSAFLSYSL